MISAAVKVATAGRLQGVALALERVSCRSVPIPSHAVAGLELDGCESVRLNQLHKIRMVVVLADGDKGNTDRHMDRQPDWELHSGHAMWD